MTIGTVKFFNVARGFGFIAPEDGSKKPKPLASVVVGLTVTTTEFFAVNSS